MQLLRFLFILLVIIGIGWLAGWYVGTFRPVLFTTTPFFPATSIPLEKLAASPSAAPLPTKFPRK